MVDLSILPRAPVRPAPRMANVISHVSGFFALMGAAMRVSRAVEARRTPSLADLRALGIDAPLPRTW